MPAPRSPSQSFSRRGFMTTAAFAATAALSACVNVPREMPRRQPEPEPETIPGLAMYQDMYSSVTDKGYEIPAVPVEEIDPRYFRQTVSDPTGERPGTIVVDTASHFLFHVRENGRAMRYGVGLGRAGFDWSGRGVIEWKQRWPRWYPPDEMIDREPELEEYRAEFDSDSGEWNGGMEAGINNPLGARALYIFQDGKDTLYRVHGSPEWWSIGKSVSSGCVRLINQDIIHLYERVEEGSPIVVMSGLSTI